MRDGKATVFLRAAGERFSASPSRPGYVLLAMAVVLNLLVQGPGFFDPMNLSALANSAAPLVLVSLGQMTLILAGCIDLSAGACMALSNAIAIVAANSLGLPLWEAWGLALAASVLVGLANGLIVAGMRLPAFLATFATSSIVQGLALIVLPSPGGEVPKEVYSVYNGFVLGVPTPFIVIAAATLVWSYLFSRPIGLRIRAVGGNQRNAFLSGASPTSSRLAAFAISGFFTGLAGLCLTAFTASGDPWIGAPYSLKSMAAVILGGTLFDSGWGGAGGTIAGSFFFVVVSNVVFFAFAALQDLAPALGASSFYQDLAANLIVVFGLVSSAFFKPGRPRAAAKGGSAHDAQ